MSAPTPEEQVEAFAESIGAEPPYQDLGVFHNRLAMFTTPESMVWLQGYINAIPNGGERAVAATVFGMTWNLACKYAIGGDK